MQSFRRFVLASTLALVAIPLIPGQALAAHPTLAACWANARIRLAGTYASEVRLQTPSAGTTVDARLARFTAYPARTNHPFTLGKRTVPARLCVVGGMVLGQQSRLLTWDQMKTHYDGDGLRIAGRGPWYVVDGLRVDNVSDGISPRGTESRYPKDGDGFHFRNLYFRYIRDDCVENDDIAGGVIEDSLFDGCNTGISERPSSGDRQWSYPAPPAETLIVDRVLLRLQAMPGPRGSHDPKLLGHGNLFKWSSVGNRLVVRNSVFLVERVPNGGSWTPFPARTVAQNVTLVWRGPGAFRWKVPAGVRVTTDRGVWDRAKARWLARHGCSQFGTCSRLHNPAP